MTKRVIDIRLVYHGDQRYDSFADWEDLIDGTLRISVSKVGNWRYEYLTAIHELLEATLCLHAGVSQAEVDAFDIPFEKCRMEGKRLALCGCEITDDPGMDRHAPYRDAHIYATSVEYGLAKLLDVDPKEYDQAFIALDGGVAGNRK